MQRKSSFAHEMYTITEAITKFRHFLFGHIFIIGTDQKSLRHLLNQVIQTPKQEEWLYKLMDLVLFILLSQSLLPLY